MAGKKYFLIIPVLIFSSMLSRVEAIADSGLIKISRQSSLVDISDILDTGSGKLSESDVKRICAEITDRYHKKGYTAFFIKSAVLNKDGSAELLFNESAVADITVTGVSHRAEDIAASVFRRGDIFNEYKLKENVTEAKKRFNIKQLNVTVKRSEDGDVVLEAAAVERVHEIESEIFNSPIYGILPEFTYSINYGEFIAGVSAASSFSQFDRSSTRGSIFFNSSNIPGNSYFNISANVSDNKDSYTDEGGIIYIHKSLTSKAGFCYNDGASVFKLYITGTVDDLAGYPGQSRGVSFSGFLFNFDYNNSPYKIDYNDITSGGIEFSTGWNFIEEKPVSKLMLNYIVNIPFYSRFFFSLNGNSFYTTDNERFSHIYVYDQMFPCRIEDFSSASWRNIAGVDIVYEAMKRTIFLSPEFKWGVHNAGENNNVYAAGMKFLFNTGRVKMEIAYLYDLNYNIRDGFLMFSAGTAYL